jgi:hypothetical protein
MLGLNDLGQRRYVKKQSLMHIQNQERYTILREFRDFKSNATSGKRNSRSANKLSLPFLATHDIPVDGTVTEQAIAAATCFGLWN